MSKSLKLFGAAALASGGALLVAYNFADRNIAMVPEDVTRMNGNADPDYMMMFAAAASDAPADGPLELGRAATGEEIAAWDKDVSPDGTGLPAGSGSVEVGEVLFSENCASCHGEFAEGVGNWPKLSGGEGTLADDDPVKTVGSYWPHLSTAWDYVNRSMPFGNAQTLEDDEVYAIVAYILYSNFLVEDDFVLSDANFLEVEMPNAGNFVIDDRPETEYGRFSGEVCMSDCKEAVEITMRAAVLDVTPEDEDAPATNVDEASVEIPEVVEVPDANIDPDLIAAGEKVFRKCKACHQVGEGARNRTGPHLNNLLGRRIGQIDGFKYSKALTEMGDMEKSWDNHSLSDFLEAPKGYAKGTKMAFAGLRSPEEREAILAYLAQFSE
ncbi:sulfur dehydrogenase subunit SoxD [Poseidonocella pacifica]|uniref:Sulfur dehydrogenase subunit SoxD n=1 Tax=Poseidonocella pacifica TaxID=871651 RepID=A0A1I0VGH7_9RHOB|nr:c-type cytochrome [Poseidonocella pacifica]SFA75113.1 sulfur dehydrogenase subunit SoxD [Poseidonocella pacifica]